MGFSPLISGTLLSPNCSVPRNHAIDTLPIHYMAALATAKACCESFLPKARRASSNYTIGYAGEMWGCVDERNRAWTTGSSICDNRGITIECSAYMDSVRKGELPTKTWYSLIALCADICKRYGKTQAVYTGSASWSTLKSNQILLVKHKWFQYTDCPGPWLDTRFDELATAINKAIGSKDTPVPSRSFYGRYRCNVGTLNVRTSPSLKGVIVAEYHLGDIVVLDDWFESRDGFIWGRYTGLQSGKYRYVAVGKDTGKPEANDYLIKEK